jgi:hypothetical protein
MRFRYWNNCVFSRQIWIWMNGCCLMSFEESNCIALISFWALITINQTKPTIHGRWLLNGIVDYPFWSFMSTDLQTNVQLVSQNWTGKMWKGYQKSYTTFQAVSLIGGGNRKKNYRPVASHWQTLLHNVVSRPWNNEISNLVCIRWYPHSQKME